MESKALLRKKAAQIKKTIDMHGISEVIQNRILESIDMSCYRTVMLYMPLKDEIDTSVIFKNLVKRNIVCCFPVVSGKEIIVRRYSDEGFTQGAYGISEPVGDIVPPDLVDLVIVPGIMFDTKCKRLGRGGGYYDRFLCDLNCLKFGVCPDVLLVDELPYESHDISVDIVVTDKRMIYGGR